MNTEMFSNVHHYLQTFCGSSAFTFLCFSIGLFLLYQLVIFIYDVARAPLSIHYVVKRRKCIPMYRYTIPFSCAVNSASFSEIECTLKSDMPCIVRAFWGVRPNDLFNFFTLGTTKVRHDLIKPFSNFAISSVSCPIFDTIPANEEIKLKFKLSEAYHHELIPEVRGMRERYPFVLFMIMMKEDEIMYGTDSVVAMVYVIHIRDNSFHLPTQIIDQYGLFSAGFIGRVKKMYHNSLNDDDDENFCSVCYQRPVSIVCLPCCHASVCDICFNSCDKCPMCRSVCFYYFKLQVD